jgi:hypothetical protein
VELPANVTGTNLYAKLAADNDLLSTLNAMRSVVEALARTTSSTVPSYTDHTIKHMDALWAVSDQILTESEVDRMTPAEAFLLSAGFYLHDVGMAYAATKEGLKRIEFSAPFRAYMSGQPENRRGDTSTIATAVAISVRQLHANAANELATNEIPGSGGIHILADKAFRDAWGQTCGTIACSHHWSIPDLEVHFGLHRSTPLPGGRNADLLYVAACLRLVDYAHINRDRASSIDRAFRYPLAPDSLIHWLAQENIDGPLRDNADYLIYRAARPMTNVDSWWLYYEMIIGLDAEIRSVTRTLDRVGSGHKQLSLRGVRGATSPDEAASYFPTAGFLPIEVNLRTGSIDKLVELLAGETLYGPNPMAPVMRLCSNPKSPHTMQTAPLCLCLST